MDSNETKIYTALLIAAALLAVFFIFFIITIIRHQRRNQALYKEKINTEINTLEKERVRISTDLHDDLGPMLSVVKLLADSLELNRTEDKETLEKINLYLDNILQQLKRISEDLMPQALTRNGLIIALDEFITELNSKQNMQVRFQFDKNLYIPVDKGIHLYRIIHEVIHNALKHSNASILEIGLHEKQGQLVLTLQDNGRGFDVDDPLISQKGLGLKSITSRVEALKGNLYLQSSPDNGTGYTIEIPLTKLYETNDAPASLPRSDT